MGAAGAEVAEKNALRVTAVEGIRLRHGVGIEIEHVASRRRRLARALVEARPVNTPAEGNLEALQRFAGDRIDHLLMKARIGLGGSSPPRMVMYGLSRSIGA